MDAWIYFFNQLESYQLASIAGLGLLAGILGGLLGVGGGVIIIPALALILGPNQHLYQATAMIASVAISIPAALRHHKAGAINSKVLASMLPAAVTCILLGVYLSNLPLFQDPAGQRLLQRILAGFMVYVIYLNLLKLRAKKNTAQIIPPKLSKTRGASVGGVMGTLAGLLGIGGGAIAVPLQQVILHIPLRSCIANSSAVICISSIFGAIYKNMTLSTSSAFAFPGLALAGLLIPGAILGGRLGAKLTHLLPLKIVRMIFILLLSLGAYKLAGIPFFS